MDGKNHHLAGIVERNIRALLERREREEARRSAASKISDAITAFTGSMPFVWIHVGLFGVWIVGNSGWIPHFPRFDPEFIILAMFASVEAIFLSTFILISQNRMARISEERNELNLQISLLAEHEVTRIVSLVAAIADRMGIREEFGEELGELEKDVRPEAVLDEMGSVREKVTGERE